MVTMKQHENIIPTITLNDGTEMPAIGFGTYKLREQDAYRAVRSAIEVGYRHIDTASLYRNEEEVGRAVADAITAGEVARDELFITTKVWNDMHGDQLTQRSFQESLQRLGLDYIDCCMVHWPWPQKGLYVESFAALAKIQGLGQLQSVAVANFYPEVLREIVAETGIAPVLNQVELHPGFSQAEQRAVDRELGVVTEAWSPLGRGDSLNAEAITLIAQRYEKTPAQVALRWIHQLGCSVVPKSANPQRQRENLDIFDFELNTEDMNSITSLDEQGGRLFVDPHDFPGEVE
ncbi:aldo/keto reductase [Corynebacterium diphtheriae]|uniref:aldo/keto reductase n=1 Tax=Corynebacterium diphtheriae TaxID=1717 RepID=UPI000245A5BF|nr:aldo/keto reductase [Corynebacterium diphtheriae]AEX41501.1 putative oxidoreductase [Corynebacterium diphtheriae 31A]AEX48293.1 putative oxidoreductase [Corynebacterium diphtheriae BH8]MBG9357628.1 aldo/keto reductase [Corynebacterium diphtheriae bv. mitis]TBX15411.1 aldo/keto reductase [Corynebacterium diphtheriae]CAB0897827.1 aldo/keto reductase [Corynebacterium diphtheriae]